jgi:uncharacterized Rossmann fold enzyme
VFGAGPSLERVKSSHNGINIAADGACSYLLKLGIVPEMVVSDLDGRVADILEVDRSGGIVILHAHGDNIKKLKKHALKFKNLFGTTQARPFGKLLNFGGFTDGDRAVFLAEHFKPARINLYGMDFEQDPGTYSLTKAKNIEIKRKKLIWAKRLLDILIHDSDIEIVWR